MNFQKDLFILKRPEDPALIKAKLKELPGLPVLQPKISEKGRTELTLADSLYSQQHSRGKPKDS
jgi:hypothetical protein